MSDLIFPILVVLAGIWTALLLPLMIRRPLVDRIRQAAIRERNRNRFGRLRTNLMSLARDGKVDLRSPIFEMLYASLTVLMRNPHDYLRAATLVLGLPPGPAPKARPCSAAERILVLEYAEMLDELCKDYSLVYRWASRLRRSDAPPLWVVMVLMRSKQRSEEELAQIQQVRLAKDRLASYATCGAAA